MTHKDKSWVIRDDEQKAVWRKAAYVCACVVARGRIVATWSHSLSEKRVEVCVHPLVSGVPGSGPRSRQKQQRWPPTTDASGHR